MSIEGRISVDCLFHDKNGTASLKVVSLQSADAFTSGNVAVVTGTVGTAAANLWSTTQGIGFGGYRDSSGSFVTIGQVSRICIKCNSVGNGVLIEDNDLYGPLLWHNSTSVAVCAPEGGAITIKSFDATQSFTAVLYGS